jgi:excisionase family DNA binding protein
MEAKTLSAGERTWITVPEAASELRIPRTRAYQLIQRGELPAVRMGRGASVSTEGSSSGSCCGAGVW